MQPATPVESRLVHALLRGRFVVTADVVPPLSAAGDALGAMVEPLRDHVDALVVRASPGRRPGLAPLAAAGILAGAGLDPVLAIAPGSRHSGERCDELVGGAALGVRTLLIEGGDARRGQAATPDDGRLGLIRLAASLRDRGVLPSGHAIDTPPRFFIGAVESRLASASGWRPDGLRARVAAGAQFIVVRSCFDVQTVRRALARLEKAGLAGRLFVLIAVEPAIGLRSSRPAASAPGVAAVFSRGASARSARPGTCAEFIAAIAEMPGVAGAHFVAPREAAQIAEAVAPLRVRKTDVQEPHPPQRG